MSVLTLIIGLDRNYRGAELEVQLQAIGIRNQRSPGVEGEYGGHPLTGYASTEGARVVYGRELRSGEIGCALAHRESYLTFLSSAADWALIFEDDARIVRPDALAAVFAHVTALPAFDEPAILMLYGRQMIGDPRSKLMLGEVEVQQLILTPMTATAYFINRTAAQHIIDTGLPLRNPADWPVSVEGTVRFAGAYPWIAMPDEVGAPSSIGERGEARSPVRIFLNRLDSLFFVKFFKKRKFYRSSREYWDWEVRRRFMQLSLRQHPYRVPDGSTTLPEAGALTLAVDRVFRGHHDRSLIEYLSRDLTKSLDRPDATERAAEADLGS